MKTITLTRGKLALVSDEDFERVNQFKWYAYLGQHDVWYAMRDDRTGRRRKAILMHRFILGLSNSEIWVDHRDRDGLNNQRENLRVCTRRQNKQNSVSHSRSRGRFKGTRLTKYGTWRAMITIDGKRRSFGSYPTEEEAAAAYNDAANRYFGEFSRPNVIMAKC